VGAAAFLEIMHRDQSHGKYQRAYHPLHIELKHMTERVKSNSRVYILLKSTVIKNKTFMMRLGYEKFCCFTVSSTYKPVFLHNNMSRDDLMILGRNSGRPMEIENCVLQAG
jgi:hypothetical protein